MHGLALAFPSASRLSHSSERHSIREPFCALVAFDRRRTDETQSPLADTGAIAHTPKGFANPLAHVAESSFFGHETALWHETRLSPERTKAILLRSKRSLAHGKSPGRQIRQSRYASKTSPLRARTRFRGQKVGPSLSNQDCYRPDRPRRARTAQTPLKPPLRQAGPFGAPDRRDPARN